MSKKASLGILALTAVSCSKATLSLFDDPEGTNLLVVVGLGAIIYLLSLISYVVRRSAGQAVQARLLAALLVQIAASGLFYVFLR